jgi:hypothetical protein
MLLVLLIGVPSASGAEIRQDTIDGWNAHVRLTEAHLASASPSLAHMPPQGETIAVPFGLIHHWRGAVFVPHVTLDAFLDALMHPGTPPPQEDVLEARVLNRSSDSLRVYVKLVRRTIISVTYNTEHEMTFLRESPTVAASRSVATRIAEVADAGTPREHELAGSDDHGFLWRLNSYWRYTQTGGGVWVELESLTLSRDLPAILRPVAAPIVNRVARESMTRTLEAMLKAFAARRG